MYVHGAEFYFIFFLYIKIETVKNKRLMMNCVYSFGAWDAGLQKIYKCVFMHMSEFVFIFNYFFKMEIFSYEKYAYYILIS